MSEPRFREGQRERQDLVSTNWLGERLGRPDIALVDASVGNRLGNGDAWLSDRATFQARHIPGARFADLVSEFSKPEGRFAFTRPTAPQFACAAGGIGLANK
jgi:thiosulfate/3-mercaptopyruvate sulfurtransferase